MRRATYKPRRYPVVLQKFQPTPSLRRATTQSGYLMHISNISTHALLAEGDASRLARLDVIRKFQPTPSLRRATPSSFIKRSMMSLFQPTPSLRRATGIPVRKNRESRISTHALLAEGDYNGAFTGTQIDISTHALLAEGDCRRACSREIYPHFNPRPPCGGRRPRRLDACKPGQDISTHALLAEGDGTYMVA